jgi:hypothetical protein
MIRPTSIERAFDLARSGQYPGVDALRKQLKAEGLPLTHIQGPSLVRQLREICLASQAPPSAG